MRRLLVFAAVFGAGLAILFLVAHLRDRRAASKRPPLPPQPAPEEGPQERTFPLTSGEEGEGPPPRVAFDGAWSISHFDPNDRDAPHALYHMQVERVRYVEADLHELNGISVRFYDAYTGEVRATMEAVRGEARFEPVPGELMPQPTGPVQLSDVELTLVEGAPFVPLTLKVPRLRVDLDQRIFSSDDPVRLEGSGMDATSIGLEVREREGLLRLVREGEIDLRFDAETRAELDATGDGSITLTRSPGESKIEVVRGALLVLEGRESLRSESEHLVIAGEIVESDGEERFRPREAVASGGAHLQSVADTFDGKEARFDFDAEGVLERATLTGEPRAAVWVDAALEEREAARRVRIDVSGRGPMTAHFLPGSSFELQGPGRIEVPAAELTVTAERRIAGSAHREQQSGHVDLEGAVVATLEGAVFEGPSLALDFRRDAQGEAFVEAASPGPSELRGEDAQGRQVRVKAGGEARWILRGRELEVPLARDAHLSVIGEGGFEASAGLLRDFRRSDQTFTAEEGVEYRSAAGSASAPRVVVLGPEHVEFQGGPDERAVIRPAPDPVRGLESGQLSAHAIERLGERVVATGEVKLELAAREGRHELEAARLELTAPEPAPGSEPGAPRPFVVRARDVTRAQVFGESGEATLTARELELRGKFLPGGEREDPTAPPPAEIERLDATGEVHIDFQEEARFSGEGERFTWTPETGGRLEGSPAERARAWGQLSAKDLPYRMSAERIDFDEERLGAQWPQIVLDEAPLAPGPREDDVLIGASSEWMSADRSGVLFSGVAHLVGRLSSGREWTLNAGSVHLFFHEEALPVPGPAGALRSIVAWDGFAVAVGDELRATGELMDADFRTLRMEGRPARLALLGFEWESPFIEYDLLETLVHTEQGRLSGGAGTELEGWTLRYESLRPFETPDSTILVLRNPVFTNAEEAREARAAWALFWVDRDLWRARTAEWLGTATGEDLRSGMPEEPEEEIQRETPSLFGQFQTGRISKLLNEVYVEGDVEYLHEGRRIARMDAAYLDLVDGHGWLQNAEVLIDIKVRDEHATLVARAEWMRHSADGSLHADSAIATTCTFADPHYFVQTKDLRFTPSPEEDVAWDVSLKRNSLRFDNGLGLPLPAISYDADRSGRPIFDRLLFGDSARFGKFVAATLNGSLGAAGDAVAKVAKTDREDVDGRIRYTASYLGSRGFLLGTGVEARAAERFWTNLYVDAIPDSGEDKGLVRVPEDDRPDLRYFLRGRARYLLTGREWLDFALETQSDPGVQSEFYEGEFLHYEERDTYVHWRKAEDGDYRSVTARVRLDDFRNYVSELPRVMLYEGAAPLTTVHGLPLVYRADTDIGLLRRQIGTSDIVSPFDPTWDDTLGDTSILRLDSDHRFTVPIPTRAGAWTVAPFTDFRGTFWSEATGEEDWSARGDVLVGMEASSTYFKTLSGGGVHSLTPSVGVRADIASLEDGGEPIPIDEIEDPREGVYVDLGLRSQWWKPGEDDLLAIDLRSIHAADVEADAEDGWLGVAVLAELATRVWGLPIAMNQDGRYDFDDGDTLFSRSRLGFSPHQNLGFEVSFATGRDDERERLYEAFGAGARWRASQKWEFEAQETIDLRGAQSLDTRVLLRRYGHDFIFELEVADRSGEGQSFSVGVRPVLGFRPPALGLIEKWLDEEY